MMYGFIMKLQTQLFWKVGVENWYFQFEFLKGFN